MSYVSVLPATLATAATEVARIGSALSLASAVAAAQTSAVQAAAADEVSAAIAALFSAHGRDFQALSARAAAFHHEFVQALAAGAGSYAVAEIAAASPLQSLIDVFNAPIQAATGRPLIGNGANGQAGHRGPGGPGGWLIGNGGAGGSGGVPDNETDLLHHKTTEIHQAVLTTYPNHDIATVVDWMLLAAINALIAGDQSGANYHLAWAIAAISTRRSR